MWPDDLMKIYSILVFELQHLEKIFWRARLAYLTAFLALLILPARTEFSEVGTSCLFISLLLVFAAVVVYDCFMEIKRTKLLNQLYWVEFELGVYEWLRLGEKDNRRWKKLPYPGHFHIWSARLIFWIILILMTANYSLRIGPSLCLSEIACSIFQQDQRCPSAHTSPPFKVSSTRQIAAKSNACPSETSVVSQHIFRVVGATVWQFAMP